MPADLYGKLEMRMFKAGGALFALTMVAGCGGTPDCGAEETLEVVQEIVDERLVEGFSQLLGRAVTVDEARELGITPNMVRMTDYNEQADIYYCDAALTGNKMDAAQYPNIVPLLDGTSFRASISYEVSTSATDDGEFIVSLTSWETN